MAAVAVMAGVVFVLRPGPPSPDGASPGDPWALPPLAPAADSEAEFAGSESCAACHGEPYGAWRASTHGRAGGAPSPDRVIAPFDGGAITFADARVRPTVDAEGRHLFVVSWKELAPDTFVVAGVVGGGFMEGGGTQGFFWEHGDGTLRFLPFDWSRHEDAWFCNTRGETAGRWVRITRELPLARCADWPPLRVLGALERFPNCEQCHGSRIRAFYDSGERRYRTHVASLAIDCESCHGPAGEHVRLAEAGDLGSRADIGLPDLDVLDTDASIRVCLSCHSLKRLLHGTPVPGEPLEDRFSLLLPILTDRPYFPDGRVRTFGYQLNHLASDCYLSGSMTCTDCHDPHGQGYRDPVRRPLEGRFDDGQCLGCHPSKASDPEAHTRHPPGSAGARCVSCHMPYLQHPSVGDDVRYARSDHTIPLPRPARDERMGVRSACGLCHGERSPEELQATVDRWYGELKPPRPLVEALLAADRLGDGSQAARALLLPEDPGAMARFAGLARFVLAFVAPAGAPRPGEEALARLGALAADRDPDVRALALAALHLSGDRQALDGVVTAGVPDPLRLRWARAVSYVGDARRFRGDAAAAADAYRLGLEVLPRDADLLERLGAALGDAGESEAAEDALRRSLESDGARPGAWLNLAFVVEGRGRGPEAVAILRESVERFPWEPLAHFWLGSALLRRGDLPGATLALERALDLDAALVPARVGLARLHLAAGNREEARRQLLAALDFEPGHAEATELLEGLGHPGGGSPP